MSVVEYTEFLVKSICSHPDMVKVELFDTENGPVIEVIVHEDDKGVVIGKNGNNIKAIRTLINVKSFREEHKRVRINIDSF